jgi:hypothetical protein
VHSSPIGLMIYPRYGLWHSYRGALGFQEALDVPELEAAPSPCNSCRERWFLNACPVGAFSGSGYHVAACAGHLKTRPARIAWARDAGRGAPARSVQPMHMARARRISPCGRFCVRKAALAGIDRGHDPDRGAEGNAVALGAIGRRLADFRRRRGANRFALAVVYAVRRLDRQRCRDDPVKSAADGDVEIEILGASRRRRGARRTQALTEIAEGPRRIGEEHDANSHRRTSNDANGAPTRHGLDCSSACLNPTYDESACAESRPRSRLRTA